MYAVDNILPASHVPCPLQSFKHSDPVISGGGIRMPLSSSIQIVILRSRTMEHWTVTEAMAARVKSTFSAPAIWKSMDNLVQ